MPNKKKMVREQEKSKKQLNSIASHKHDFKQKLRLLDGPQRSGEANPGDRTSKRNFSDFRQHTDFIITSALVCILFL